MKEISITLIAEAGDDLDTMRQEMGLPDRKSVILSALKLLKGVLAGMKPSAKSPQGRMLALVDEGGQTYLQLTMDGLPKPKPLIEPVIGLPTYEEILKDIAEHPEKHKHTYEELRECCLVTMIEDGEPTTAFEPSLLEAHAKLRPRGPNSPRNCDVIQGHCGCGAYHENLPIIPTDQPTDETNLSTGKE